MTETTVLIDPKRVEAIFEACVWDKGQDDGQPVEVEGIAKAEFAPTRLSQHESEVVELLGGLPNEFKRSGGGGYSFLNGCTDANGEQWTGLQMVVEQLFLLGMGVGRVSSLMPREMWPALPGGVPYYVVEA
jgi:hypothetical protein